MKGEKVKREIYQSSLQRLLTVAPVIAGMEIIVFFFEESLMQTGPIILAFLISNAVTIPLLYISSRTLDTHANFLPKFSILLYTFTLATFGAALSLATVHSFDLVHVYLSIIIGISFFIYFNPLEHALLLGSASGIFIFFLFRLQDISAQNFVTLTNVVTFSVVSWVLGRVSLATRITTIEDKHTLEEQNILLEKLARQDQMTSLLNHETSFQTLSREIQRVKRSGLPLTILLFDVDNFKSVNEEFGHLNGDKVLIEVANLLLQVARTTDYVARYGGDEFLIIMPETPLEGGKHLAERLWAKTEKLHILPNLKISFSGGLIEYSGENSMELVAKADAGLFKAKKMGKNQFVTLC